MSEIEETTKPTIRIVQSQITQRVMPVGLVELFCVILSAFVRESSITSPAN